MVSTRLAQRGSHRGSISYAAGGGCSILNRCGTSSNAAVLLPHCNARIPPDRSFIFHLSAIVPPSDVTSLKRPLTHAGFVSWPRTVDLKRVLTSPLAESSLIGGEEVLHGVLPGQLFLDPPAPELAHPFPLLWMVQQPQEFFRKIRHALVFHRYTTTLPER